MRIHQHRHFGLAEHVYKARRDNQPARIDDATSRSVGERSDGGNVSVLNGDIAGIPRRAGSVNDVAIANDQVEALRDGSAWQPNHKKEH